MNPNPPSHQSIAARAYSLWEQAGRPGGRDQEFWSRAESELTTPTTATGAPPVIAPPVVRTPQSPTTALASQVPPPIKDAVKTPGRRPPLRRLPKRA